MTDATLYSKRAYDLLVWQTGRDLNDGLGRDPRRNPPAPLARLPGPPPLPGDPPDPVPLPATVPLMLAVCVGLAAFVG